jgi:hypothetical protein
MVPGYVKGDENNDDDCESENGGETRASDNDDEEVNPEEFFIPLLDLFHEDNHNIKELFSMLEEVYSNDIFHCLGYKGGSAEFIKSLGDTHKGNDVLEVVFTATMRLFVNNMIETCVSSDSKACEYCKEAAAMLTDQHRHDREQWLNSVSYNGQSTATSSTGDKGGEDDGDQKQNSSGKQDDEADTLDDVEQKADNEDTRAVEFDKWLKDETNAASKFRPVVKSLRQCGGRHACLTFDNFKRQLSNIDSNLKTMFPMVHHCFAFHQGIRFNDAALRIATRKALLPFKFTRHNTKYGPSIVYDLVLRSKLTSEAKLAVLAGEVLNYSGYEGQCESTGAKGEEQIGKLMKLVRGLETPSTWEAHVMAVNQQVSTKSTVEKELGLKNYVHRRRPRSNPSKEPAIGKMKRFLIQEPTSDVADLKEKRDTMVRKLLHKHYFTSENISNKDKKHSIIISLHLLKIKLSCHKIFVLLLKLTGEARTGAGAKQLSRYLRGQQIGRLEGKLCQRNICWYCDEGNHQEEGQQASSRGKSTEAKDCGSQGNGEGSSKGQETTRMRCCKRSKRSSRRQETRRTRCSCCRKKSCQGGEKSCRQESQS